MIYPKFSIVIPCYNQIEFIHECYISIVSQSYRNWEAIFVNDGSTDGTEIFLNRIEQFDKKVKVITKPNGGLSSARNDGIKYVTGNFVIFLDSDDMLLPDCLKFLYCKILKHPTVQLIQMGYRHISQNDQVVYRTVKPSQHNELLPSILFDNIGPVHSVCVDIDLINKTGFFDEDLKSCEDWDYWIRVAFQKIHIKKIEEALVDYRMNEMSMSRNSFILFDAMKTVSKSAYEKYKKQLGDVDTIQLQERYKACLKRKLAMCLGVSIFQKKVNESKDFFLQVVKENELTFIPEDFKAMSSYLTFRYKTSEAETLLILKQCKELFEQFFVSLGYSKSVIKKCIWAIFSTHYYLYYTKKMGYVGKAIHKAKIQLV